MRPTLLTSDQIDAYVAAGHWSRETLLDRYDAYAQESPDAIACRDSRESVTWAELAAATDRLAAGLVALGVDRDETALVQMPSSCREITLRIAFKKAGIIAAFAPMQWRRRELDYVYNCINPRLIAMTPERSQAEELAWLDTAIDNAAAPVHKLDVAGGTQPGWVSWDSAQADAPDADMTERLRGRQFRYDEVSLITVSSGTSGLAKLCEWPEGAQMCVGRALGERMAIARDDNIGMFAPMSGAAGLVVWLVSAGTPCTFTFPDTYRAPELLDLVQRDRLTAGTTVPVILARLAQEPLDSYDLGSLRFLRVGTAAADIAAAQSFEDQTGCRVVIASGAMECPGFGHAGVDESKQVRLNGSVGLPLRGCRLRIDDEQGNFQPSGTVGELKVSAPFASSGYWNDPETTALVWSDGWYATGDMGRLNADGRLTLMGRLKETINRSGLKILPAEVEKEISKHPDVFDCAVVAAPDKEYGEVPWAFVQMRPGALFHADEIGDALRSGGLPPYKIPVRIVEIATLPRVNDSKIDKNALRRMVSDGGDG